MANAIGLMVALPYWYFEGAANPFSAGALTLIPAVGALALIVGMILGLLQRRRSLLLFLAPFALSEGLVGVAGLMRGTVPVSGSVIFNGALVAFLAVQLATSGYLMYRLKGARSAAAALTLFSLTYGVFSVFVAGMSFTDSWL